MVGTLFSAPGGATLWCRGCPWIGTLSMPWEGRALVGHHRGSPKPNPGSFQSCWLHYVLALLLSKYSWAASPSPHRYPHLEMRRQVDHVATREEPPAPLKSICKHPGWELGPEWSRLCDQPDKHPTGFLLRWGDGGRDRADGAPRSPHVRGSKALSLQAQQTRKALLSNSFTERERKSPARFSANVLSGAKSSLSSQPS